jgi:predicted  nucleic acid-binding Zn-ribbon protein
MSFLVIDFIIFTVAATVGFIFGAFWVDSEFERDSAYLAAEVESLNEALDVLEEQYQELNEKYRNSIADVSRVFNALDRSIDYQDRFERILFSNKSEMTPELRQKLADFWKKSDRIIDLG